ncbi:daptide-type RiPP biosynthesis methyltransferase [Microbispora sp. NPDC049125]|uniref:daptide-type RiPP biosynthesis methyltransferase n=1 Tax=Microbispora sp. NPDC049125 TaxID=3154929 RepID=UPI003466CA16
MHPEPRFFGVFEMLSRMNLPLTEVMPVYTGYYAALYDALSETYEWDLDDYLKLADRSPGGVLELGCGSGRITVPLAREGHQVVALDSSPDMLALLRRRLAKEDESVAGRVTIVRSDMRGLRLDRRFGLILLPANNISLLADEADRREVFARAREHLAPGGRFAFDNALAEDERLLTQNGDLVAFPASSAGEEQFVLSAHRYLPDEGVQLMNFYAESVDASGRTRRFLGGWTKAVLPDEAIDDLLAEAGLRTVETQTYDLDFDRRRMRLYTCVAGG